MHEMHFSANWRTTNDFRRILPMIKRNPFTTIATGIVDSALDKAARGLQALLRGKKPGDKKREPSVPSSWRSAEKSEETPVTTVSEVSEVSRTVQLFLSFSHLDGYVAPCLKLECVQKRPDADAVAIALNHAMCVMRYICQSDVAFCEGALERMINLVEMHDDMAIAFTDAWMNGCDAASAKEYLKHFKDSNFGNDDNIGYEFETDRKARKEIKKLSRLWFHSTSKCCYCVSHNGIYDHWIVRESRKI